MNPLDREHDVDCTAGAITITLEDAIASDGRWHFFTKIDASANAMTIDGLGAQTISGATTVNTDVQWLTIAVRATGSGWIGLKLASATAAGAVTSVGLSLPTSVFDVTGSPVTSSGTLTATFDTQSANTFFAGPTSGGAATPTFRGPLVTDDHAADSVTFAKMQNIATDRLIGRDTASSGDPEELTVGGGIEFSGSGGIQSYQWLCFALGDETTAITTGTAKLTFRLPQCTVIAVRASLTTVSSSGIPTFDINEAGTTILSTKLTIDASEKTSTTAAAAAVISDSAIADDAEITIDIDTAGTGAAGAKIYMKVRWT